MGPEGFFLSLTAPFTTVHQQDDLRYKYHYQKVNSSYQYPLGPLLTAKPFLGSLNKRGQGAYEPHANARKYQQNLSQSGNRCQWFGALNVTTDRRQHF
jgi:hypothetical protein